MSDSIPDYPKKRPSKKLPVAKPANQVAKYQNEADIWNLDDDSAEIPLTTPRSAALSQLPMLRLVDEPDSVTTSKQVPSRTREEPTPAEEILPATAKKEEPIAAGPKKPPLTQTENDIWDTFLDDEPPKSSQRTAQVTHHERDPKLEQILQQPLEPQQSVRDIIRPPVEPSPTQENLPTVEQDTPLPPSEIGSGKTVTGFQITKFTRLELVTSLLFMALLLIGGVIAFGTFRSHVKAEIDPYATPDFPVKGNMATVAKAETYWRTPVKDGPNPDPTKLDVILLPVISITLNDCKAKQGALRILFLNHNDEIVGDAITRSYSNNHFDANQSATLAFSSTAGFVDFGEQEAYRAKLGKPWSIRVLEGPNETADSDSFQLLFKTPIAIARQ